MGYWDNDPAKLDSLPSVNMKFWSWHLMLTRHNLEVKNASCSPFLESVMGLASLSTNLALSKHPLLSQTRELKKAKGIILPGTAPLKSPPKESGGESTYEKRLVTWSWWQTCQSWHLRRQRHWRGLWVLCLLNIEGGRRRKRHILFNTEHSHKIVVQNKDKWVKSMFIRYCRKYQ